MLSILCIRSIKWHDKLQANSCHRYLVVVVAERHPEPEISRCSQSATICGTQLYLSSILRKNVAIFLINRSCGLHVNTLHVHSLLSIHEMQRYSLLGKKKIEFYSVVLLAKLFYYRWRCYYFIRKECSQYRLRFVIVINFTILSLTQYDHGF